MINIPGTSLRDLYRERSGRRGRSSSFDRTGGNRDFVRLAPGETVTLFDTDRPGCITHIWITMASDDGREIAFLPRKLALRMYWDGEKSPSVEAPLGDFFGMGHGITKNFSSAPLAMSPQDGRALNCFFPMPYAGGALIRLENGAESPVRCYFYIDHEIYPESVESPLRFHAQWRRELTRGVDDGAMSNTLYSFGGKNTTGEGNYVILDAAGRGHYVGCNINIHNLRATREWNWYGEGDDMIFIDGEKWPPSLHGTGMEDYFGCAWCPTQEYHGLYNGILLGGGPNWSGKVSFYRYHIEDPIMFTSSIRVTIEHGHDNHRSDDYSSTAYWYQTEPHRAFGPMGSPADRLPLPDVLQFNREDLKQCFDY